MKITLYRSLHPQIQKHVRSLYSLLPFRLRMGSEYRKTSDFLNAREHWTRDEIELWQLNKLKTIVSHAYQFVPGYTQLYRENGIAPSALGSLEDLKHFPFVSKELIRDNLKEFTSTAIPKRTLLYRTTGGSTGIPFGFFLTQQDIERELAFLHNAWSRAGWKPGDRSAVLRGAFIGSEKDLSDYDPLLNDVRLSTYFLNGGTYKRFKKILEDRAPKHLQAYPSAASIFADLVNQNEDAGNIRFDLLLLGSENLYEWQKEKITSAFPQSRIFSWYGHAEQVLFAPMCESSEKFHLDPFYGFAEILDNMNHDAAAGSSGELVGTSLWNFATPLIRYRTMDFATRDSLGCEKCGRGYQLLSSIDGRLQELIITKTGRLISMTALNMHSNVFDNVKQFQFRQNVKGKVTFNIVRNTHYGERDREQIIKELTMKLGSDVDLELEYVDSIELPRSGKFRFLIQELPLGRADDGH